MFIFKASRDILIIATLKKNLFEMGGADGNHFVEAHQTHTK
jgi:hypothetical protein